MSTENTVDEHLVRLSFAMVGISLAGIETTLIESI